MISRIIYRAVFRASYKIMKQPIHTTKQYQSLTIQTQSLWTPTVSPARLYSKEVSIEEMAVDFETVKKATEDRNILIVDVREPDEVKEHGKIPSSINIPLGSVTSTLGQMSEKEFQKIYNRPKPGEDTEIIFYCMIGKRSGMAQENAQKLGYRKVKNYLGSWNDWAAKIST